MQAVSVFSGPEFFTPAFFMVPCFFQSRVFSVLVAATQANHPKCAYTRWRNATQDVIQSTRVVMRVARLAEREPLFPRTINGCYS